MAGEGGRARNHSTTLSRFGRAGAGGQAHNHYEREVKAPTVWEAEPATILSRLIRAGGGVCSGYSRNH